MNVIYDKNQKATIHSSLQNVLAEAASRSNLEEALSVIGENVNAQLFGFGRGGNHVWLSVKTYAGFRRIAIIA